MDSVIEKGEIDTKKPEQIDDWEWHRIADIANKVQQVDSDKAIYKVLKRLLDSAIKEGKVDTKKPEQIDDWEWHKIKNIASKVQLFELVEAVINRKDVNTDKPKYIDTLEWDNIRKIEKKIKELDQIESKREEVEKEASKLSEDKIYVESHKKIIQQQLEFINSLLKDPSSIDRIESYDNTFAPGNLDNLRKVADMLIKSSNMVI